MSTLIAPNINQLIEEWEKDSKVDTTDPGGQMIQIPVIHSKYNKYLSLHKLAESRREAEFNKMRKLKWMYYNGKMNDKQQLAELGWEPFPFTLKSDVDVYMDADDDLIKLRASVKFHSECISFCTYVMKELNNRTWQMKEWMAWERFERGN